MKRLLFLACLPLCLAGFLFSDSMSFADTQEEAQQAIQSAYAQMDAATAARDPSGIIAWLTPDFKEVEKDGKVLNSQKFQMGMAAELEASQSIHTKTVVQNVQMQVDNTALVTVNVHTTLVYVDAKSETLDHGSSDEVDRDLWQKTDQGWREKISHTLTLTNLAQKQNMAIAVSPQVKQDAKDAIQDICADIDAATVRGDASTAAAYDENPALKLQDQQALSLVLSKVHDITSITTIQSIKIVNKSATQALLIIQHHIAATLNDSLTDQPVTNEINSTGRELWDKDADGWHVVGSHLLKRSFLVNGTAVNIAGFTTP